MIKKEKAFESIKKCLLVCPPTPKKSGVASLRLRLDSVEAPSVAPYALTEGERPLITSRRSRFVAGDGGEGCINVPSLTGQEGRHSRHIIQRGNAGVSLMISPSNGPDDIPP